MSKPQDWKPGESGNPNGSPDNGNTFQAHYDRSLFQSEAEFTIVDETKLTMKEIIVRGRVKRAKDGSDLAQDRIEDRLDGKPKQSTDINATGTFNVTIDSVLAK